MTNRTISHSFVVIYTANADYFAVLKHILQGEGLTALLCDDADLEAKLSCTGTLGVILDAEMDDVVEVCKKIKFRPNGSSLPILAAIPNGDTNMYLSLMRAGADHCLIRPFWPPHLLAFFKSFSSTVDKPGEIPKHRTDIHLGPIEVRMDRQQAFVSGEPLHLGPIEFRLLSHLLTEPGKVFTRTDLIKAVWSPNVYVQLRTVDVHIGRIRRQLRKLTGTNVIRTSRASGYAIEYDDQATVP